MRELGVFGVDGVELAYLRSSSGLRNICGSDVSGGSRPGMNEFIENSGDCVSASMSLNAAIFGSRAPADDVDVSAGALSGCSISG